MTQKEAKVKIWYQTLTTYRYDPVWDEYGKALEEQCKRAASPDTEVYVTGVPLIGKDRDKYKFIMYYHKLQCLNNMLRAEREGYDVFVIGASEDPGLVEGRGMLGIPVVGIAQASLYVAGMLGELFAIVTSPHNLVEMYRQRVREYGLEGKYLRGDYSLDVPEVEIAKSLKDPALLATKFKEVAKRAVGDGASVIVPLPPFIYNLFYRTGGLTNLDGATVLDPVAVAVIVGEMFVHLKKVGIEVSRMYQVYSYPGKEAVQQILEKYRPTFKIGQD